MSFTTKTVQLIGVNIFKDEAQLLDSEIELSSTVVPNLKMPQKSFVGLSSLSGYNPLTEAIKKEGVEGVPQTFSFNFVTYRNTEGNKRTELKELAGSNTLRLNHTQGDLSFLLRTTVGEWAVEQDESLLKSLVKAGMIHFDGVLFSNVDYVRIIAHHPDILDVIFELEEMATIQSIIFKILIEGHYYDALAFNTSDYIERKEDGTLNAALSSFSGNLVLPAYIKEEVPYIQALEDLDQKIAKAS